MTSTPYGSPVNDFQTPTAGGFQHQQLLANGNGNGNGGIATPVPSQYEQSPLTSTPSRVSPYSQKYGLVLDQIPDRKKNTVKTIIRAMDKDPNVFQFDPRSRDLIVGGEKIVDMNLTDLLQEVTIYPLACQSRPLYPSLLRSF